MADWFTYFVAEACAGVVASNDVRGKFALTDRVTAQSVTVDIAESADVVAGMRDQFAEKVDLVLQSSDLMTRRFSELRPREWRAAAEGAARGVAAGAQPSGEPHARKPLARLRWRNQSSPVPDPAGEDPGGEYTARERSYQVFAALRVASDTVLVRQDPVLRELAAPLAAAEAELRAELVKALTLRVNAIIDAALAESYEREFSFVGSTRMPEHLDAAGEDMGGVNREAARAIQALIDSGFTGAVGVAGPRGIGKTTLLTRFARSVPSVPAWPQTGPRDRRQERWGVCVAAPSQYDARDFLLHLFGRLCAAVLGEERVSELEDEMTGNATVASRLPVSAAWLAWFAGVTALLCGGLVLGLWTARPVESGRAMIDLLIAGCSSVVAIAVAPAYFYLKSLAKRMWSTSTTGEALKVVDRWHVYTMQIAAGEVALASGVLAGVLYGLVAVGSSPDPGYVVVAVLAVAAYICGAVLRPRFLSHRLLFEPNASLVRFAAEDWYRKVKFQQSYTSGWSGTVTLAPSGIPVQAQAGWNSSRSVTPVSMSTPEIVAGLRSFIGTLRGADVLPFDAVMSEASGKSTTWVPVPVVIGIDEVDKIEDPQAAQAWL